MMRAASGPAVAAAAATAVETARATGYAVTSEHLETFERDGCVRLEGVFGPAEMGAPMRRRLSFSQRARAR
jgi:hypothetical protein